jgi:molybdopterin synthase sulfur carrier subunit
MALRVLYFAWVRERIGTAEETIEVPAGVVTARDLIHWLSGRGESYAAAFERADVIRVAIDRTHKPQTAPIGEAREIAFFPPVTGG